MSKLLAGAAFVLLGGATATGSVFLYKKVQSDTNAKDKQSDPDLPTSLEDFKKTETDKPCLKTLFPGLSSFTVSAGTDSEPSMDANFLSTAEGKPKPEGCLVVHWDKKTKPNETTKWSGTIRFLWAVKGENKGFIVFLAGTTSGPSDKKLKWEGTANALTLTGTTWTVKKQKEVTSSANKDFSNSSDENKFPSPGDALTTVQSKTFWDFLSNKSDLENVDSGDNFNEDKKYRGHWKWQGTGNSGDKELGKWAKDLSCWWNDIFTTDPLNMTTLIQNQKGTWTNVVDDPSPKTNTSAT